jgi:hypothetical protein
MGTAGAVVAENVAPVSGTSSSGPAGGVGGGGGAGGFSGLPTEGTQLLILDALRTLAALYAQTVRMRFACLGVCQLFYSLGLLLLLGLSGVKYLWKQFSLRWVSFVSHAFLLLTVL